MTNTGANQVSALSAISERDQNPTPDATLTSFGPVSVALDPFGNPVIAEGLINRVFVLLSGHRLHHVGRRRRGTGCRKFGEFLRAFCAWNAGDAFSRFPVPAIRQRNSELRALPLPTTLGDVQVLVGGVSAPLLYASPGQINFQVPGATPMGGFVGVSSSARHPPARFWRAGCSEMDASSPGLFTADGSGAGQLVAVNQDGSC